VLGQVGPDGSWGPLLGDGVDRVLAAGRPLAVGGLLLDVLRLAKLGSVWGRAAERPKRRRPRPSPEERRRDEEQRRTLGRTLLPAATIGFGILLVLTMVVFGVAEHLGPVDSLFTAVSTAFGSPALGSSNSWLKVFAVAAMVAGGALVGVLFAWLAAVATTERLEERMGRRARHLSGHAVVAGLGRVGWEVERLLYALRVPAVVVEMAPDPRFLGTVSERTPVLSGDARLPENLERARIREAKVFLACTSDDLANIEACIQAKRLNPAVRTVARIFDDSVATRVGGALGIDVAVSTTRVAARAFVGAALDERSFRSFDIEDVPYLAFRYEAPSDTATTVLDGWREGGVRILAHQDAYGEVHPPSHLGDAIRAGERLTLAGPAESVRRLVLADAPAEVATTPARTTP
jgi:Trk K+ transport system NAD-binding subunit